jgi:putative phosphoesterase
MKIAFISDIHANLVALEAVLVDIASVSVDEIICLGDIASLGPQPNEVTDRIRSLGCAAIQGNHDPLPDEPPPLSELGTWTEQQLSQSNKLYLQALPATLHRQIGNPKLLCVHGSPRSVDEQILASTTSDDLDAMLANADFNLLVSGHTYLQLFRRLNGRTIVGVGSVGTPYLAPFDGTGPPRVLKVAEYAIVGYEAGKLAVDLRQTTYDFEAYRQSVDTSGMPFPNWCEQWAD